MKPALLWASDEKGYDDRKYNDVKAVVTRGGHAGGSTTDPGMCSFGHISLVSFISAAGRAQCGCVASGKLWHEDFTTVWPGVVVEVTEKGSVDNAVWVRLCKESWLDALSEEEKASVGMRRPKLADFQSWQTRKLATFSW